MDKQNLVADSLGWDAYNWGNGLDFWLQFLSLRNKSILELGCGCDNGGLSLWAAGNGASRVVCSDYLGVKEKTRSIHKEYGFSDIIHYDVVDALDIPYKGEFDIVCFKSLLGGIVRDGNIEIVKSVLLQGSEALKDGGMILLAENLSSSILHIGFRKIYGAGKNLWRYFEHEELSDLISEIPSLELIAKRSFGFFGCFGRNERQRTYLGRFDKIVTKYIVPEKLCYIQFLIARKL